MNVEATIRKNIDLWAQQYNAHDAAGLAAWYAAESIYITPTGLLLVGSAQIHAYFQSSFDRSPNVGITVSIDRVVTEKEDLVIGDGKFEVTNLVDPNGKPLPVKGPWVSVFLMKDGRWIPLAHASAITLPMFAPAQA